VSTHPSESWFWSYCDAVEKKHPDARSELELEMLEFRDFRNRAGGEGSVAYFIDSYDIRPSRVAKFLTRFAPPEIGAIARDMSLRYPDDMPKDLAEREAYILSRFTDGAGLSLQFEWRGEEDQAYERLDEFCVGEGALELYRKLRECLE